MANNLNPNDWITTATAAEMTCYTSSHIRWLIREGRVRGKKFGRDWMVKKEDLLDYKRQMDELGVDKHNPWRAGARRRSEE